MVNITIEYQPFPILKYTRKINGSFPSAFSELKPAQLIAISKLINLQISETTFLYFMTGFRKFRINRLDDYYRYQLMQLFEPFTAVTPHNDFIIPQIKKGFIVLVAPKAKLSGMTLGQFIFVENYFSDYQQNKRPSDLHKFVASLYLKQNHSFNEKEINENALIPSRTNQAILDAIVINYVLIKEWLAKVYPLVYQLPEDPEKKKKPKPLKNPGNSGWITIFENIVGDDLINHDRYAMLPLHNVLRWMTTKIKDNMKRK